MPDAPDGLRSLESLEAEPAMLDGDGLNVLRVQKGWDTSVKPDSRSRSARVAKPKALKASKAARSGRSGTSEVSKVQNVTLAL